MPMTYIVRGRILKEGEIPAGERKPKPKAKPPESYHRGFRVEGHRPGEMESCRERITNAFDAWWKLPQEKQRELRAQGAKEPKRWDEESWRRNSPRHLIKRADIASAADIAAQMARRLGWTEVSVIELVKGEKPAGLF
jgi:hypothetical protein